MIASLNSRTSGTKQLRGFTLIEIAVVLIVISILLATIAIPLSSQLTQRRIAETQRTLDLAQQALLGFATAAGRLPCPATDGNAPGTSNTLGAEAFAPGPPLGTEGNGNCAVWIGFLPARTLGLSPVDTQGFLLDGWGISANRVRYAVFGGPAHAINSTPNWFTRTNGIRDATQSTVITKKLIYVCSSAPAAASRPKPTSATPSTTICGTTPGENELSAQAPAVIYSLGANAPTGGISAHEIHNSDQDDFVFVAHEPTVAGSPNGEFDDIVTWISLPALISRMQQAGRLQPAP